MGNIHVKVFYIWKSGSGRHLREKLAHCGHMVDEDNHNSSSLAFGSGELN